MCLEARARSLALELASASSSGPESCVSWLERAFLRSSERVVCFGFLRSSELFFARACFWVADLNLRIVGSSELYHNFITDFETKINLLKLAHFVVIVSRQYPEKEASIGYLEGVIEKLRATREMHIEEPILYIKMQIATFQLEKGSQKECKKLLEDGKSTLDSMTDIDPSVYANYYWVSSQYHKSRQEFAEFYNEPFFIQRTRRWSLYQKHLSW
ncbi:hypothetical protein HYC85_027596 [Camellia sinensis]|uniref:PSD13 N-terminal domain-containing protein n=1 Tax=Camellia sinensis TaxID=4442 RepID=A0A7J7G762_CAMSI|nr:hypothetical protein HYC85_027596 [Camellia sinensis]